MLHILKKSVRFYSWRLLLYYKASSPLMIQYYGNTVTRSNYLNSEVNAYASEKLLTVIYHSFILSINFYKESDAHQVLEIYIL